MPAKLFVFLILALSAGGQPVQSIDGILQEAQGDAKHTPLRWKQAAVEAAAVLNAHDATAVTHALYARLKTDGPDGVTRALVSRIAHVTKSFEPDAWLIHLASEQDPFILVAGMQIFDMTSFKTQPRFQDLLKSALKDIRVGRALVGEEPAYSDEGLRVCDTAYNLLIHDRKDRPAEFPLDVSSDSLEVRDRLITKLCEELQVAGPLSSSSAIVPRNAMLVAFAIVIMAAGTWIWWRPKRNH